MATAVLQSVSIVQVPWSFAAREVVREELAGTLILQDGKRISRLIVQPTSGRAASFARSLLGSSAFYDIDEVGHHVDGIQKVLTRSQLHFASPPDTLHQRLMTDLQRRISRLGVPRIEVFLLRAPDKAETSEDVLAYMSSCWTVLMNAQALGIVGSLGIRLEDSWGQLAPLLLHLLRTRFGIVPSVVEISGISGTMIRYCHQRGILLLRPGVHDSIVARSAAALRAVKGWSLELSTGPAMLVARNDLQHGLIHLWKFHDGGALMDELLRLFSLQLTRIGVLRHLMNQTTSGLYLAENATLDQMVFGIGMRPMTDACTVSPGATLKTNTEDLRRYIDYSHVLREPSVATWPGKMDPVLSLHQNPRLVLRASPQLCVPSPGLQPLRVLGSPMSWHPDTQPCSAYRHCESFNGFAMIPPLQKSRYRALIRLLGTAAADIFDEMNRINASTSKGRPGRRCVKGIDGIWRNCHGTTFLLRATNRFRKATTLPLFGANRWLRLNYSVPSDPSTLRLAALSEELYYDYVQPLISRIILRNATLITFHIARNLYAEEDAQGSMLWHWDKQSTDNIKVLVQLNIVTEQDGCVMALRHNVTGEPARAGWHEHLSFGKSAVPRLWVAELMDNGYMPICAGGMAGNIVIWDNNVIHRGSRPAPGKFRDVFYYVFAESDAIPPDTPKDKRRAVAASRSLVKRPIPMSMSPRNHTAPRAKVDQRVNSQRRTRWWWT